MPEMGKAHKLLSARHPDTSRPAGGADPDDGQVATWSAALGAWIAADAAGGVTDHGLLSGLVPDDDHAQYAKTDKSRPSPWVSAANLSVRSLADLGTKDHDLLDGLGDDDHPHYALADKSRPSPWMAAADLAARSLADLGTKDHDLLDGLTDDDHSIYALLSGRSGGQTLIGGIGSGDHLTLRSTSHAVRGRVRSIDDVWFSTGVLRGPDGNARAYLQDASPHLLAFGDVQAGDRVGIGTAPVATMGLKLQPSLPTTGNKYVIGGDPSLPHASGSASAYGFKTQATSLISSGASLWEMAGLYFIAAAGGAGAVTSLYAAWVRTGLMFYTGAAPTVWGLKVRSPLLMASTFPSTAYGVEIDDQGLVGSSTQDAIGLKINDQTVTSGAKRLIEAGPATPYLRLVGGANPAANQSNLYLKLGATLKLLTEYDADSAGVGYRALRVPN